jgi:hypothetical protein
MHIDGFWLENLKDGDHLKYVGIDGRVILKMDIKGIRVGREGCGLNLSGSG